MLKPCDVGYIIKNTSTAVFIRRTHRCGRRQRRGEKTSPLCVAHLISAILSRGNGRFFNKGGRQRTARGYIQTCLAACGHHFGIVGEHSVFGRGPEAIPKVKEFKKLISELQASDAGQTRFHELGPEGWFAMLGYDKLIKSESSEEVIDAFRFFPRIVESEPADAAL